MQKRTMYIMIQALTLCLLLLIMCVAVIQQAAIEPMEYITFQENIQGLELHPYYEETDDKWYLFLPAYVSREAVTISSESWVRADADGNALAGNLDAYPAQQDIVLQIETPFRTKDYVLQIQQCTNLMTISLSAEEGTIDFLHANIMEGKDVFVTMTDAQGNNLIQQIASMSGRGNGTWNYEKRPYNLTFSNPISVGPFQQISKLCLLAELFDEMKMRNSIAYLAAQNLDFDYTTDYMYCNLFINGVYRGLFGITTKQEYTKHIQSDGIQAVFEYTKYPKANQFFAYPGLYPIRLLYGNMKETKWAVEDFCAALHNQDWETVESLIDMRSFAQKYVMDEFFANYDMGINSQHFYIDADGVIHAMLPWDYDWSMGSNWEYYDVPPERHILTNRHGATWSFQLMESPAYRAYCTEILDEYYTEELFQKLDVHMEETANLIMDSLECDILRWQHSPSSSEYVGPLGRDHVWELIDQFNSYFPKRKAFLRDYFADRDAFYRVAFLEGLCPWFYVPKGARLADYHADSGVWEGANLRDGFVGWYTDDGQSLEDIETVTENLSFYAKFDTPAVPEDQQAPETGSPIWLNRLILWGFAAACLLVVTANLRRHVTRRKQREEAAV